MQKPAHAQVVIQIHVCPKACLIIDTLKQGPKKRRNPTSSILQGAPQGKAAAKPQRFFCSQPEVHGSQYTSVKSKSASQNSSFRQ